MTTANPRTTEATSHGSAAEHRRAQATAAHTQRGRRAPAPRTHASATTAASISPVGVRPASAIQNSTATRRRPTAVTGPRSRSTAAATHGRQP